MLLCVQMRIVVRYLLLLLLIQVVFAKGAHYALPDLGRSGYEVIGLDWTMDPKEARYVITYNMVTRGHPNSS